MECMDLQLPLYDSLDMLLNDFLADDDIDCSNDWPLQSAVRGEQWRKSEGLHLATLDQPAATSWPKDVDPFSEVADNVFTLPECTLSASLVDTILSRSPKLIVLAGTDKELQGNSWI